MINQLRLNNEDAADGNIGFSMVVDNIPYDSEEWVNNVEERVSNALRENDISRLLEGEKKVVIKVYEVLNRLLFNPDDIGLLVKELEELAIQLTNSVRFKVAGDDEAENQVSEIVPTPTYRAAVIGYLNDLLKLNPALPSRILEKLELVPYLDISGLREEAQQEASKERKILIQDRTILSAENFEGILADMHGAIGSLYKYFVNDEIKDEIEIREIVAEIDELKRRYIDSCVSAGVEPDTKKLGELERELEETTGMEPVLRTIESQKELMRANNLDEVLKPRPGYSTYFHSTWNTDAGAEISDKGLWCRGGLGSTAVSASSEGDGFDQLLDQRRHSRGGYRNCVVIMQIPHDEIVFYDDNLDNPEYQTIPPKYILGYLDTSDYSFVRNEGFISGD